MINLDDAVWYIKSKYFIVKISQALVKQNYEV